MYTHASQSWSRACCSIHHHDEALRSDQSQSVLHQCDSGGSRREGPPVPLAAQAGNATRRNTLLHVTLPLHQSCAGWKEKAQLIRADKATQTPQLRSSVARVAEQDINTAVVRGLCTACVAQWVEHRIGHSGPTDSGLACSMARTKTGPCCLITASAVGAVGVGRRHDEVVGRRSLATASGSCDTPGGKRQ